MHRRATYRVFPSELHDKVGPNRSPSSNRRSQKPSCLVQFACTGRLALVRCLAFAAAMRLTNSPKSTCKNPPVDLRVLRSQSPSHYQFGNLRGQDEVYCDRCPGQPAGASPGKVVHCSRRRRGSRTRRLIPLNRQIGCWLGVFISLNSTIQRPTLGWL